MEAFSNFDQRPCVLLSTVSRSTVIDEARRHRRCVIEEHRTGEGEEKHRVVATISWGWPSQIASIIEIDGKRFMIKDFLKRDTNLFR